MSHEQLDILDLTTGREALEARLAAIERAYDELLQRVRRYERERAEIRSRIDGLLARIQPARSALR